MSYTQNWILIYWSRIPVILVSHEDKAEFLTQDIRCKNEQEKCFPKHPAI